MNTFVPLILRLKNGDYETHLQPLFWGGGVQMPSRNHAAHSHSSLMKRLAQFLLDIQKRFSPRGSCESIKVTGQHKNKTKAATITSTTPVSHNSNRCWLSYKVLTPPHLTHSARDLLHLQQLTYFEFAVTDPRDSKVLGQRHTPETGKALNSADKSSLFSSVPNWWLNYIVSLNGMDYRITSVSVYISYCRDTIFCIAFFKCSYILSYYLLLKMK